VLHEIPAVTSEVLVPSYWIIQRHISENTDIHDVSYTSQILEYEFVDMIEIIILSKKTTLMNSCAVT
jgi:hypothetical protein